MSIATRSLFPGSHASPCQLVGRLHASGLVVDSCGFGVCWGVAIDSSSAHTAASAV